jgi:transcriptional regulator with XRE-family HTH domain
MKSCRKSAGSSSDAVKALASVGQRIGQRQTFVSKFELGERRLDAAEFVKVSRAVGADPYKIMREAEAD